ncbi:protein of unknown function [Burkholderia multivorans]
MQKYNAHSPPNSLGYSSISL